MDKISFLRELERLAIASHLGAKEIRLFLLLLAYCESTAVGTIGFETVRKAVGADFTAVHMKEACERLAANGLVEVVSPLPDEKGSENFTLQYRLRPLAGRGGHTGGGN